VLLVFIYTLNNDTLSKVLQVYTALQDTNTSRSHGEDRTVQVLLSRVP